MLKSEQIAEVKEITQEEIDTLIYDMYWKIVVEHWTEEDFKNYKVEEGKAVRLSIEKKQDIEHWTDKELYEYMKSCICRKWLSFYDKAPFIADCLEKCVNEIVNE